MNITHSMQRFHRFDDVVEYHDRFFLRQFFLLDDVMLKVDEVRVAIVELVRNQTVQDEANSFLLLRGTLRAFGPFALLVNIFLENASFPVIAQ